MLVVEAGKMTPSNNFLKSINLSTKIYETLLERLANSTNLLKGALRSRSKTIQHNKSNSTCCKSFKASSHSYWIRKKIAEVRFYRGYLHTISLLEASYERERRRDW